ncbi:hypothetical protein Droror1_Dr00023282 [Drosera rotundifolia]
MLRVKLARFEPYLVAEERHRMNRLEQGLNWRYREPLSLHTCHTYQEIYEKVVNIERIVKQKEEARANSKRRLEYSINQSTGGTSKRLFRSEHRVANYPRKSPIELRF